MPRLEQPTKFVDVLSGCNTGLLFENNEWKVPESEFTRVP
jgi:hypothetical protein